MPTWLIWLIASGAFAAAEAFSLTFVLVMFAGGAAAGAVTAALGGPQRNGALPGGRRSDDRDDVLVVELCERPRHLGLAARRQPARLPLDQLHVAIEPPRRRDLVDADPHRLREEIAHLGEVVQESDAYRERSRVRHRRILPRCCARTSIASRETRSTPPGARSPGWERSGRVTAAPARSTPSAPAA